MANNRIQVKRTSTTGRTANTTDIANTQYIAAGELALNMTDGILYSSNGSALITVGANLVNQRITNSLTLDNDKNIYFRTVNTSASVGFRQQNDDNFVFYSTNTAYGQRAVWSIFANSITSSFDIAVPLKINSALTANGTTGTAGQVLTSNGTATYWSSAGGGGSGTVTSVATGNGMTGGPITTTGTVSVLANTGIVANATGVFVNAAYIATIASNSATYANSSVTNTFTVGTASYFVSNGNLGIGNTTPSSKVHTFESVNAAHESLRFQNPNTGSLAHSIVRFYNDVSQAGFYFNSSARTADVGINGFGFYNDATGGDLQFRTPGNIAFQTASSNERVRITSGGNVGINNTAPTHRLSVNGDMFVNTSVTVGNSTVNATINSTAFTGSANNASYLGGYTWAAPAILGSTTANGASLTYANVSGQVNTATLLVSTNTSTFGTAAYVVSNGNVGIGNNVPVHKLRVQGDISLSNNIFAGGTKFIFTSGDGYISRQDGFGGLFFDASNIVRVNSSSSFQIDSRLQFSTDVVLNRDSADVLAQRNGANAQTSRIYGTYTDASNYERLSISANSTAAYIIAEKAGTGTARDLYLGANNSTKMVVAANGNLGVGTLSPGYKLEVTGSFAATTKSFVIKHPTKPNMTLRHGSLEGPENGVYIRGRSNSNVIELPEYWVNLVYEDSITVSLTPIGNSVIPRVGAVADNKVYIKGSVSKLDYFYHIFAERKDVEKLLVEF